MRAAYLERRIDDVIAECPDNVKRAESKKRPAAEPNESVTEIERLARSKVLRRLDQLEVDYELRQKVRPGLPTVRGLAEVPKTWVETRLVDAVLRGAPSKLRGRLAALRMFPEVAPNSLSAAASVAVGRARGRRDGGWIGSRLRELRAGVSTEPLVVTSVRLLLSARDRSPCDALDASSRRDKRVSGGSAGHAGCLRVLCDAGAFIDDEDGDGWCALHHAASAGDVGVVEFLVSQLGADVEGRLRDGSTPLHLAVSCRCGEAGPRGILFYLNRRVAGPGAVLTACFFLRDCRVDVTTADVARRTPLHKAAGNGRHELVELLLVAGASPKALDCDGVSPLDLAVKSGNTRCADKIRTFRSPLEDDTEVLSPTLRMDVLREHVDLDAAAAASPSDVTAKLAAVCARAVAAVLPPKKARNANRRTDSAA